MSDRGRAKRYFSKAADRVSVTLTTVETITEFVTIPARNVAQGDRLRIKHRGLVVGAQSTDTLNAKLYLNSQVLAQTGPVDVATNDGHILAADVAFDSRGSAGVAQADGRGRTTTSGAADQVVVVPDFAVDTESDIVIAVKYTWSVSHASNIARGKGLEVYHWKSVE